MRSDDEDVLADQIVTEGSHSPADVIYTENSPALEYLQGKGLLAKVDPATLARTPAQVQLAPGGLGRRLGARQRAHLQPGLIATQPAAYLGPAARQPRYRGKLAIAPGETDFQPIVTSVMRKYGRAAALRWLKGIKANAGGPQSTPTTRPSPTR